MNRLFAIIATITLLALAPVAGCKKENKEAAASGAGDTAAAPAAASGSYTVDQACDKMAGMMEAMAAAVTANKGNCDGMGDALQKWVDDNKDFMAWAKEQDKDATKKDEFEKTCEPKLKPVMEKVGASMAGAGECGSNEKVKAALAALE
jgi:hypothetical protein